MAIKFKIEGMKELQKSLKKIGQVPQKHVTASARKGMNISLKQSKANAPYDTGALKKGIVLKGERSSSKGKKVYRIVFDRAMNDIFQKKRVHAKTIVSGKRKKTRTMAAGTVSGYYPVSQEYGYFARNGRYIPGFRFVRDSLTDNVSKIEKTIVAEMKKKIDAEIAKGGLK